jgi:hypothetical protein
MEQEDPPVQLGAAIIREHLKYILKLAHYTNNAKMHQAHLMMGAFFFAMRPKEFSGVKPGDRHF